MPAENSATFSAIGQEQLTAACYTYLAGLHCTLWGRSFNVKEPASREEAAQWLALQIEHVLADA